MNKCNIVGTQGYPCTRNEDHLLGDGVRDKEHQARNEDGMIMQIWKDDDK